MQSYIHWGTSNEKRRHSNNYIRILVPQPEHSQVTVLVAVACFLSESNQNQIIRPKCSPRRFFSSLARCR